MLLHKPILDFNLMTWQGKRLKISSVGKRNFPLSICICLIIKYFFILKRMLRYKTQRYWKTTSGKKCVLTYTQLNKLLIYC